MAKRGRVFVAVDSASGSSGAHSRSICLKSNDRALGSDLASRCGYPRLCAQRANLLVRHAITKLRGRVGLVRRVHHRKRPRGFQVRSHTTGFTERRGATRRTMFRRKWNSGRRASRSVGGHFTGSGRNFHIHRFVVTSSAPRVPPGVSGEVLMRLRTR